MKQSNKEKIKEYFIHFIHQKVFYNMVLMSYPTQLKWICSLCGEEGTDTGTIYKGESYSEVKRRFSK